MNLTNSNLEVEPKLFNRRREDTIVSNDAQSGLEGEMAKISEQAMSRGRLEAGREGFGCAAFERGRVGGKWKGRQIDRLA